MHMGPNFPRLSVPTAMLSVFVVGTGLLHLAGIGFGYLTKTPAGTVAVRAAGGVVALVGAAFLVGIA